MTPATQQTTAASTTYDVLYLRATSVQTFVIRMLLVALSLLMLSATRSTFEGGSSVVFFHITGTWACGKGYEKVAQR